MEYWVCEKHDTSGRFGECLMCKYQRELGEIKMIETLKTAQKQVSVEPVVMPNEVLAGGQTKGLFKILQWLYEQEDIELRETGWYCKDDELSTQEVLVKYFASQREA